MSLVAGVARAADDPAIVRPSSGDAVREAQSGGVNPADVVREAQGGNVSASGADLVPQIVIATPNTPTTDRDPTNVTGVGQMVVDEQNGFIGLCTASLINPRTVVFAAHCVNERPANAYGQDSGGQPIGFGFSNSNNTTGASAVGAWLNGSALTGGVKYTTIQSLFMYDSNYVAYNPGSLDPNAAGFLYSDVAVASLDKPAAGIPTWAMLFSALPPTTVQGGVGTGYIVKLEGYGNNGTGTTGSTGGIDFRRRIAENILGGLASLGDFEQFLFGPAGTSNATNPQNLYWIDFDDPKRGTAGASPFDFNAWRDNAVSDGQEGITASGDSGGPLILEYGQATQLIIGVLSGGYTRFFNQQPANGYGTASFYQPLYLYWDWIAANNPYHYVSAVAGNGNWTDPNHWVTNLDPSYYVLSGGTAVNGIPTTPGAGATGHTGTFGQACFQSGGVSDCKDMATGTETIENKPIGSAGTGVADSGTGGAAQVDASSLLGGAADGSASAEVASTASGTPEAQSSGSGDPAQVIALPPATLANGLPGATGFVPNDYDGDRLNNVAPRYFDVTLSAAGTTTLNSTATVDRFKITGGSAMLDIQAGGSLTSLMDINQITGTMQVNGSLTSIGDYFMLSGGLNGTGTINSPFFTSVAGTIAPATAGTIGTLNFNGNIILSTGSTYLADLGSNGTSDRINVTGGAGSGVANVGGRVVFTFNNTLRAGNTFTIVTAANGVTGRFLAPTPISAILTPTLVYPANQVQVLIVAGRYVPLFTPGTQAYQFAQLLDQNRGVAANYDGLYGPLDLQGAATIVSAVTGLVPSTETTIQSLGVAALDNISGFLRGRLNSIDTSSPGGAVAHYGAPIQVAANNIAGKGFGPEVRSDVAPQYVRENALPETMSAFVAGGYINGDSAPMIGSSATGRDKFDGWYGAAGIESAFGDGVLGLALSYTRLNATGGMAGQLATASLFQGSLYGKVPVATLTLDAQLSFGLFAAKTTRNISLLGTPYTLTSSDNPMAITAEVGLGQSVMAGGVKITPRAAFRASQIGFSPTIETGGPMALYYNRGNVDSIQARGGLTLEGTNKTFKPYLNATYVHEFRNRPAFIGANLVGGIPGFAAFSTNVTDHDYGEVSGGLTYTSHNIDISVSAESSVFRSDVMAQSYRGGLTIHF